MLYPKQCCRSSDFLPFSPNSDAMLPMLKPTAIAALLGLLSACTPLPTSRSALPSESPRPIPTLPAERLLRQQAIATPKPKTATAKPPGKPNPTQPAFSTAEVTKLLSQAEDKAIAAANLTQSAQSKEDWALVINQWKRAIAILQPASNANLQRALVQQRLKTYQNNLAAAQQQAKTNPRQLIQRAGGSTKGGIPLIVAPASPDAKPSPTASPTPLPAPPPPPPKS
ncbi:MAG: hypothetical protein HC780_03850 [Leptolyngbyaceae cyanobacterium CSU_1_3]|nr:hypothetical protein [Leptolyngbyaceae cyanobacterium CSU_1_3]